MDGTRLEISDLLLAEFDSDGDGPKKFNCWNLCREIYARAGRTLPLYSQYIADISQRDKLIEEIKGYDFVRVEDPEFLAIVTLRLSAWRPDLITHVGVVVSMRRFVHIRREPVNVEMPELTDKKWIKRIEGFYRYVG